MAMDRRNYK